MTKKNNKKKILAWVTSVILLIALGFIFWPREKEDPLGAAISRYELPEGYTRADLEKMIATMAQDPEFKFHFQVLDAPRRQDALEEIFALLLTKPSRETVRQAIGAQQEKVQAQSTLFYSLDYPEDYVQDPGAYPALEAAFWHFIEEEFKLAVLGVYYKTNLDRNFVFAWQEMAVLAAEKFQKLYSSRQQYLRQKH